MIPSVTDDAGCEELLRFFDRALAEIGVEPGATVQTADFCAAHLAGALAEMLAELSPSGPAAPFVAEIEPAGTEGLLG